MIPSQLLVHSPHNVSLNFYALAGTNYMNPTSDPGRTEEQMTAWWQVAPSGQLIPSFRRPHSCPPDRIHPPIYLDVFSSLRVCPPIPSPSLNIEKVSHCFWQILYLPFLVLGHSLLSWWSECDAQPHLIPLLKFDSHVTSYSWGMRLLFSLVPH